MAVVRGTNAGFVTVAPTSDPQGTAGVSDSIAIADKDVSPANAIKITEIGWYASVASVEANYEIGLYSHHAGNDLPENLLYSDIINAKGAGAGWKTTAVDWEIDPNTTYWLARQLDNTTPNTSMDRAASGGRYSSKVIAALENPWVSTNTGADIWTLYALVETAGTAIMTLNTGFWGGV